MASRLYICAVNVATTHGPVHNLHLMSFREWDPLLDILLTVPHLEAFVTMGGVPANLRAVLRDIATTRMTARSDFPYLFMFDTHDRLDPTQIMNWINNHPPDELRSILHKAGRSDLLAFIRANPHWSK